MTTSPDRAGLLREAAERVIAFYEDWNVGDDNGYEWWNVIDPLRAALAATGDSGGPLDVERLARAIARVGKNMRLAASADEIAAEYAGLREDTEAYDQADHAAREGVPEGDLDDHVIPFDPKG